MDFDFIHYKPSDLSVNETIRDLLVKKQKTAKKTFGMFTDLKPKTKRDENFISAERIERTCKGFFY